jgi:hypothetical protein
VTNVRHLAVNAHKDSVCRSAQSVVKPVSPVHLLDAYAHHARDLNLALRMFQVVDTSLDREREMKQLIHSIRFGKVSVQSPSDEQIEDMLDYHLPLDMSEMLKTEIVRRREERLNG